MSWMHFDVELQQGKCIHLPRHHNFKPATRNVGYQAQMLDIAE